MNFDDIYFPIDVTEQIYENVDEKMIDHIRRANKEHMNELSLKYLGLQITYEEVFRHIDEHARALKAYGLKKGDMITVCLPNSPEVIYYFYACNDIGITPYLIDPRCTFEKIKICIDDSKSKLFICEMGTYFDKIVSSVDKLTVEKTIIVSPVNSLYYSNKFTVKQLIAKAIYSNKKKKYLRQYTLTSKSVFQQEFVKAGEAYLGNYAEPYDPAIPAIIVNTSGTSGDSVKGAVHTNKSYNVFMNQIKQEFMREPHPQIDRGSLFYGYIPFFTMYGSSTCMHGSLTHGAVIDLIPTFDGMKSIKELLKKKSNIMISVPAVFEKMIDYCAKNNINMSFADMYAIGGDNLSPEKLKFENETIEKLGAEHKLIYGYGSTEAMMISTMSDDERSHKYGSSGTLYPNVSVLVIEPETLKQLSFDEEGEIYVKTPTMFIGYLNKPEESKKVFLEVDGETYFKTGDKGYISEDGHLFLTGRYKRLMKRPDGHQVSPIPIENAINNSEFVEDCAVVGIKKDINSPGVIPTAFVKLKNENSIPETVKKIADGSLKELSGEREIALAYRIVDKIPITENGKQDYRTLEKYDFNGGSYYVVEDNITKDYFKNMTSVKFFKLN